MPVKAKIFQQYWLLKYGAIVDIRSHQECLLLDLFLEESDFILLTGDFGFLPQEPSSEEQDLSLFAFLIGSGEDLSEDKIKWNHFFKDSQNMTLEEIPNKGW